MPRSIFALACLRNPIGTAEGGDQVVDRERRAVAIGAPGDPATIAWPDGDMVEAPVPPRADADALRAANASSPVPIPGLVLALAASAFSGCAAQAPSQELRAFGTEPFWSVTVGSDSIRLMDMATGDTLAWAATPAIEVEARPADFARAWVLDPDGPVVLVVRRAAEGCSDGMSDRTYPWFALFLREDRLYEGCARRDEPGADRPDT